MSGDEVNCEVSNQDGSVMMRPEVFEDMLERAAHRGAKRALDGVGLHDDAAQEDVKDLRDLLSFWKSIKASAMKTVGAFIGKLLVVAFVLGLAIMMGASDFVSKLIGFKP